MKVVRNSENQEQMQLHKKHDKNVPTRLLWNAKAGASLRSHGEHLPQDQRPLGRRVSAWTSKH